MSAQAAPQFNGFDRVFLNISDPALPAYVRRLTPEKREQWIAQWNAAFSTCSLKNGSNCSGKAFTKANRLVLAPSHSVNRFSSSDIYEATDSVRVFMDAPALQGFADSGTVTVGDAKQFTPPRWVPYLPRPHVYKHDKYGDVEITAERNQEFVANFKAGVYQTRIPLDAEHAYKLSGAMGWIVDMRLNAHGGVDAEVEWTDIGIHMLREKRFRYISPEFYPKWPHPATGKIINNVATGGALTTKPFFKEPYLEQIPLVASERGLYVPDGWDAAPGAFVETGAAGLRMDDTRVTIGAAPGPVEIGGVIVASEKGRTDMAEQITAERYSQLLGFEATNADLMVQIATFNETISTLNGQLAEKDAALAELASTVKEQKDAAIKQKFSELLAGTPNAEKNLTHVLTLVQRFGEDDAIVTDYVAGIQAAAAAVKTGAAFNEIGSAASGNNIAGGDTAEAKLSGIARQMMSEQPGLKLERAWVLAMEANPALYATYKVETGRV